MLSNLPNWWAEIAETMVATNKARTARSEIETALPPLVKWLFGNASKSEKPSKSLQTLLEAIGEQELLVPVVGGFSAGKSTALNAFLG